MFEILYTNIFFLLIYQAFGAFDKDKSGRVSAPEFRRILDNFCFKLSDKQFKLLMSKVKVHSDLTISYPAFLGEFSANEHEVRNLLIQYNLKILQLEARVT